jgi:hypothetical protein
MAIIVAILGFMMDPGNWNNHHSLLNGFTNPIYLPQLMFRTPTAMLVAGVFGMLLGTIFGVKDKELRKRSVKYSATWIFIWAPISLIGAVIYWNVLPEAMVENMSTAVGTMQFQEYYDVLRWVILIAISFVLVIAGIGIMRPGKVKMWMVIIPCFFVFGFLGIFERVREFIRKPYVIGGYMYSNLLREEDYPLYKKEGILKHATYASTHEVTDANKIQAGRDVFMLTCSRCHTTKGINSITYVFERMYGEGKPLDIASVAGYIPNMHVGRTYMPPFPGNEKELDALAHFIKSLQTTGESLEGVQTKGLQVNSINSVEEFNK